MNYRHPKTDRGWAGQCARMFKTIKPYCHYAGGALGLSGNRRFEAPFEGAANADNVVTELRAMVVTDNALARAVILHDEQDGSGVVGLADWARASLSQQGGGQ